MEFIMDMVHHNPGEEPTKTAFLNPEKLKSYGYNAQVFKHINTAITFEEYDKEAAEAASDAVEWIKNFRLGLCEEISKAKAAGLNVYYHTDLFVLPKFIVEKYKDEICNTDGRIDLRREKTLEIHRAMFDEMFKVFPEVDGLVVRVGETYLHDTPYHMGNVAITYWENGKEDDFAYLINFLREEICEKHNRYVFFRTWDCFPDRIHANPDYYLKVTNQIEPHEKLVFSIKHTALDFWRRVKFNECLTIGKHRQIIEVQCQREYEGKGAYPSYIMDGVINSFEEYENPKGISSVAKNPLICGIYTWSRGGGWEGPYIKNEFWCDLNTYVISHYVKNPERSEEEIFYAYATEKMQLSEDDAKKFRMLCLKANEAMLYGRYIEDYDDTHLKQEAMPCGNWLRDDSLGGINQLREIFDVLYKDETLHDALGEKMHAAQCWRDVKSIFDTMDFKDAELGQFIGTSIDYAVALFDIIKYGWGAMIEGYIYDKTGRCDCFALKRYIEGYDKAWEIYRKVGQRKDSATLYKETYQGKDGMGSGVDKYRGLVQVTTFNEKNKIKINA